MNSTMSKTIFSVIIATLLVCVAMPAQAKVTAEEAEKLKTELNPMGGERAGNAEGTIPPWTGGLSKIPVGIDYEAKSGLPHPDPYADDKILFTITAQNVDQYKDKLSPGQVKMFERYPKTWKMNIYPTRRSAALSEDDYKSTYLNALEAEVVDEYGSVTGAHRGIAFPIPKNGMETISNFILRPHGVTNVKMQYGGGIIQPDGIFQTQSASNYHYWEPYATSREEFDPNSMNTHAKVIVMTMEGRKGEIYLKKEPMNYSKNDAGGWNYLPGSRRVRRSANMFYDGIDSSGGGIATSDDGFMWGGKLDRFNWKIVGKQEMFILYNTYAGDLLPDYLDITTPHHPNPKHLRWELHRVWDTVATLKEGARHIYGERHYYQDEDTWLIAVKDQYDKRGNLWRMSLACTKQYYDVPSSRQTQYYDFDFLVEFYGAKKFVNGFKPEDYKPIKEQFFTVPNLRNMGRR